MLLRIVVADPLPGCHYALQRGRSELDQLRVAAGEDIVFTAPITLRSRADGHLDPRGVHVQGRPGGRFLYINSGTLAAQPDSCWTRRAKVSLRGVEDALPAGSENSWPLVNVNEP